MKIFKNDDFDEYAPEWDTNRVKKKPANCGLLKFQKIKKQIQLSTNYHPAHQADH